MAKTNRYALTVFFTMIGLSVTSCQLEQTDDLFGLGCDGRPAHSRFCGYDIGLDPSIGYSCSGGRWERMTDCSDSDESCVWNGAMFECVAHHKVCTNDDMACTGMIFKQCVDGMWKTTPCTSGQTCDAEKGCVTSAVPALCKEDDARCEGGVYQVCRSGEWKIDDNCVAKEQRCDAAAGCVELIAKPKECSDKAVKCENDIYYVCGDDGLWLDGVPCGEGAACDAEGRVCVRQKQECTPGSSKCELQKYVVCDLNGKWGTPVMCGDGEVCDHTRGCIEMIALCIDGYQKCIDRDTVKICRNGEWSMQKCGDMETCTAHNNKDACQCIDNSRQCVSSTMYRECQNGEWRNIPCNSGKKCINGYCKDKTLKCMEGVQKCLNSTTLQICENGKWVTKEDCSRYNPVRRCDDELGCYFCQSSENRCEGSTAFICDNGRQWLEMDCSASNRVCENGRCIQPK